MATDIAWLSIDFRPKKARMPMKNWFKEGSPLEVYTHRQAEALAKHLPDVIVRHAMTYGNPSVADVLAELKAQGVGKLLVIPLYPQYAGSSTGAALDKVFQEFIAATQPNERPHCLPLLRRCRLYSSHEAAY